MTRPMPYTEAPPHPGRSPKFSGDDVGHEERLAAREAWDDARWKYTESIVVGRDKRLTDAECAAEYWRAEAHFLLGLARARLGVAAAAEASLDEAVRLNPAEPRYRAAIEMLRRAAGDDATTGSADAAETTASVSR